MSKTTTELKPVAAAKRAEVGPTMMGSDILVAALEREGVDTIFAYPGGASMELHQALTRSRRIRTLLPQLNLLLRRRPHKSCHTTWLSDACEHHTG